MKNLLMALVLYTGITSSAHGATVLFDDFDTEGGGTTQTNYAGFSNFVVLQDIVSISQPNANPTVDLIYQPNALGLTCVGSAGGCVDLDGFSGNGGRLRTRLAYAFNAGDVVTLSVDISGSQRGDRNDIGLGVTSAGAPIDFENFVGTYPGLAMLSPVSGTALGALDSRNIGSDYGYVTASATFRALNAGSLYAYVETASNDNVGPLIDNFRLDIGTGDVSSGVPEPATWALMVVGFGMIGGVMRRRQRQRLTYDLSLIPG